MARGATDGEKPLDWVGSSKKDFLVFLAVVKDEMGGGIRTAALDVELVEKRLRIAQQDCEVRYGKSRST